MWVDSTWVPLSCRSYTSTLFLGSQSKHYAQKLRIRHQQRFCTCRSNQSPSPSSVGCSCSTGTRLSTFHKHGDTVTPLAARLVISVVIPLHACETLFIPWGAVVHDFKNRHVQLQSPFSTTIVGLLFGLEAAALKAVPRTVPEIERAVSSESLHSHYASSSP
jgi:hypothetical protein